MSTTTENARGFHPAHVGHLVMGLAFLGLVAIWGAVETDLVSTDNVRWLLPLPWVFAGVAGLLAVVLSGRGRRPETLTYPPTPTPAPTDAGDHERDEYDEKDELS